ncbi:hypothetical protein [Limosilactobacillus fastidiosus]|uniref:YolD-like family protein n=1 Tax=Limosilactobacillus fastidiosus TaxID=2759855 RepID=A0A7W3TYE8_9LACO|nr:hypothetical protein [Limosilactobacillus fastidiosus]MBB1062463.1 hypothetical protein [Limosilactobacillus fastidiosus]MBB1085586.1 hypothetical protein [Limosilactobacillus fastidiosus]MCD7083537.1 hypothetical protein [Limosilactobacillus fastidiosus]MCD7086039.1 hypothetical protein [Limosilactobacillus fastidiosus]MCD7114317.1 hypothetical protein [Limosilactobacillus fastidiosus]
MIDEKKIIEQKLFSDTSLYNDIINRPYQPSKGHLPMPRSDRAGQFAPFAALTGFGNLIQKKAEIYTHKKYLSASAERRIIKKLQMLAGTKITVTINYFNDEVGFYEEFCDQVSTVKVERGKVFFNQRSAIAIANIKEVR